MGATICFCDAKRNQILQEKRTKKNWIKILLSFWMLLFRVTRTKQNNGLKGKRWKIEKRMTIWFIACTFDFRGCFFSHSKLKFWFPFSSIVYTARILYAFVRKNERKETVDNLKAKTSSNSPKRTHNNSCNSCLVILEKKYNGNTVKWDSERNLKEIKLLKVDVCYG